MSSLLDEFLESSAYGIGRTPGRSLESTPNRTFNLEDTTNWSLTTPFRDTISDLRFPSEIPSENGLSTLAFVASMASSGSSPQQRPHDDEEVKPYPSFLDDQDDAANDLEGGLVPGPLISIASSHESPVRLRQNSHLPETPMPVPQRYLPPIDSSETAVNSSLPPDVLTVTRSNRLRSGDNNSRKPEKKPETKFPYLSLMGAAIIAQNGEKATLDVMQKWIERNHEAVVLQHPNWKDRIRHNLTMHLCFDKVETEQPSRKNAKGNQWCILPQWRKCFVRDPETGDVTFHKDLKPPGENLLKRKMPKSGKRAKRQGQGQVPDESDADEDKENDVPAPQTTTNLGVTKGSKRPLSEGQEQPTATDRKRRKKDTASSVLRSTRLKQQRVVLGCVDGIAPSLVHGVLVVGAIGLPQTTTSGVLIPLPDPSGAGAGAAGAGAGAGEKEFVKPPALGVFGNVNDTLLGPCETPVQGTEVTEVLKLICEPNV
ncbi:hypothetical protein M427DRAFT_36356 [Gonapodya prolifera JEL478]|uniref:Fork-head domain-containing protein n=1 Tax=Gonapodya prolifera (strain JEL478) TaxID=1344416 RepID=A0A139A2L3_GONPJ|nr:hypothetical protein M427DRAFT_36356 [Gonapodya prolifera JEL478]|eukprot:KXS11026.1 hypothetical protein M427DRAFT_36356 [Gonapodya prolifera JEL478]